MGDALDARIWQIGKLFGTPSRLVVPLYQRPYVWTKEQQWEPLWTDIRRLAEQLLNKTTPKPHFLGAVVVDVDPRPIGYLACHVVVDGQQRLTTVQLFLEALADNYERLCPPDDDDMQVFARRARSLTRNRDLSALDVDGEFKVWPMNADQVSFKAVMAAGSPEEIASFGDGQAAVSTSRITLAYEYFYGAIRDWLIAQESFASAVKSLYEVVENHLQIAVIDLENSVDPQLIFETLNARGTPLLPSDLVKNFLFHQAALECTDDSAPYAQYWAPFDVERPYWSEKIGRGALRRERLDVFMHQYLTMQARDDVQVGRLYSEYRDFAERTDLTADQQLAQICTYGRIYRSLDHLPAGSVEAKFMYRLRQMDVATVMPFLLCLMGDPAVSKTDRRRILGDLESYLVRRLVCHLTIKAYNKTFVELLKATDKGGMTPEVVRQHLLSWQDETTVWPDDKTFQTAWMNYQAYYWLAQARIRMILEALEPKVRSEKSEDLLVIEEVLTIEHLMPQSWQAHYPLLETADSSAAANERERLIHTFGNLTLLTKKLNPSVSNGAWTRIDAQAVDKGKRAEILRHSNLGLNSMLFDCEAWDESAIQARGASLFKAAKKLWPHPGQLVGTVAGGQAG
jgi:hypothetical protein